MEPVQRIPPAVAVVSLAVFTTMLVLGSLQFQLLAVDIAEAAARQSLLADRRRAAQVKAARRSMCPSGPSSAGGAPAAHVGARVPGERGVHRPARRRGARRRSPSTTWSASWTACRESLRGRRCSTRRGSPVRVRARVAAAVPRGGLPGDRRRVRRGQRVLRTGGGRRRRGHELRLRADDAAARARRRPQPLLAVDHSESMLAETRRRCEQEKTPTDALTLCRADVAQLPLADASIDARCRAGAALHRRPRLQDGAGRDPPRAPGRAAASPATTFVQGAYGVRAPGYDDEQRRLVPLLRLDGQLKQLMVDAGFDADGVDVHRRGARMRDREVRGADGGGYFGGGRRGRGRGGGGERACCECERACVSF